MPEYERKHISVHIEKTAGTSYLKFLGDMYGKENVLIYNSSRDSLVPANSLFGVARVNNVVDRLHSLWEMAGFASTANKLLISLLFNRSQGSNSDIVFPDKWIAIHGHFKADKFDQIIDLPFRTVILRDPLDRAISHYRHWQRAKGVVNHSLKIQYTSNIGFRDFALLDDLQNYQTKALGTHSLEDFDVVGVTENLESFISKVSMARCFRKSRGYETPFLNKSYSDIDLVEMGIDSQFKKTFESYNELDYCNYQKASRYDLHQPIDTQHSTD